MHDAILPQPAIIQERRQDASHIFTLDLKWLDPKRQGDYTFVPGQFNMLYLYGVGEVAISVCSDPDNKQFFSHTIRAVGRVTNALQQLQVGDTIGLRGPYGKGWPLQSALGQDVVIVTGGLGCAPTVSVIEYMIARRASFGRLTILQGVKHSDDFIFRKRYAAWAKEPDLHIHIAADHAERGWPWQVGFVTDTIQGLPLQVDKTIVMMCGPEGMMKTASCAFLQRGLSATQLYLSMERNMECGIGLCGHCQYGGFFVCKDGPVFSYDQIQHLLFEEGF